MVIPGSKLRQLITPIHGMSCHLVEFAYHARRWLIQKISITSYPLLFGIVYSVVVDILCIGAQFRQIFGDGGCE